jgi:hypothetical protein
VSCAQRHSLVDEDACSARLGQVAGRLDRQWHRMACGVHAVQRGSLWGLQPVSSFDDVILEDDVILAPPHCSRASRRCSLRAARHRVVLMQRATGAHVGGDEGWRQAEH